MDQAPEDASACSVSAFARDDAARGAAIIDGAVRGAIDHRDDVVQRRRHIVPHAVDDQQLAPGP